MQTNGCFVVQKRDDHPGGSGVCESSWVQAEIGPEGMRNPALHLVGLAASPGGGGVFGTRAEEELRQWLESRLDALGIDPVAYSRFVLSLLRRPDSALSPLAEAGVNNARGGGRRTRFRTRTRLPLQGDREQRRAVVQCLTSAADQVLVAWSFLTIDEPGEISLIRPSIIQVRALSKTRLIQVLYINRGVCSDNTKYFMYSNAVHETAMCTSEAVYNRVSFPYYSRFLLTNVCSPHIISDKRAFMRNRGNK